MLDLNILTTVCRRPELIEAMGAGTVIVIIVLALLFLWAIGSFHFSAQTERFNNMQPVDFHASMLNKYQDYVYDNLGMTNKDYMLAGLLHS